MNVLTDLQKALRYGQVYLSFTKRKEVILKIKPEKVFYQQLPK